MNKKTPEYGRVTSYVVFFVFLYFLSSCNVVVEGSPPRTIYSSPTVVTFPSLSSSSSSSLLTAGKYTSGRTLVNGASLKSTLATRTTTTTTTTTTLATPTVPALCIDDIKGKLPNSDEDDEDGNGIEVDGQENSRNIVDIHKIDGDAIVSVITKDPTSALFIVNRINQVNLIGGDFEIGLRGIKVNNVEQIENILLQEVEYLQLCIEHAVGIFMDYDLYKRTEHLIEELEYNIWPIPSTRALIFPKVAHLLYQMPWGEKSASVEILAESLDVYNDFMDAARREHLCLMHFRSNENIYILLGNKLVSNFKENGTIFAVPTGRTDKSFISDLPGNSYVLMESEVEVKTIDDINNDTATPTLKMINSDNGLKNFNEILQGKNILSSEFLALSRPLIDLVKWLNDSLERNCEKTAGIYHLETCYNDFLLSLDDWNRNQRNRDYYRKPIEILNVLKLRKLAHLMTFEMFQKVVTKTNATTSNMEMVELREIASQNFVTNITTYFHYNENNNSNNNNNNNNDHSIDFIDAEFESTKKGKREKFGRIFSCQYADGTNRKFPFLFEGESVMYWRLKPEAWIAAGLTASILGIIVSLAILIFIIVRISIGDVFEGNPMSSIMLLISLTILFGSFVPFALEYGSDHLNSQITYEDAEIMNTLCAVRIFLITLCYCFTFSLLLCRALMLASIGSEGGFLSHVNGYIQSVICIFSTLVQVGLSTQLLVVMHIANENISCGSIFYGNWLWALLTYDILLLVFLVLLTPLIFRSQRNYREGILLVIGGILCFLIWCTWIPLSFFGNEWRDAAIPLGTQATGWAILVGIMIPRIFLIVRGIERSDIAQALPSLTSLTFAQNNQYASEQSIYECVNPAMRHCASREDGMCEINHNMQQSPSQIPTLPLRGGGGRRPMFANFRGGAGMGNTNTNRPQSVTSSQSSLPPSPSKVTRF